MILACSNTKIALLVLVFININSIRVKNNMLIFIAVFILQDRPNPIGGLAVL